NDPQSGHYQIDSIGGVTVVPTAAHVVVTFTYGARAGAAPAVAQVDDPGFLRFKIPVSFQTHDTLNRPNAGEPSIGVDLKTGAVMYIAGTQVSRIMFEDTQTPAKAVWTDVTPPKLQVVREDSVLFVDKYTGRTFASELALLCNFASYSDDDGANWSPSECCGPPQGSDHPPVGWGRLAG